MTIRKLCVVSATLIVIHGTWSNAWIGSPGRAEAQQSSFGEVIDVHLVTVDVVVESTDGGFVAGLKQEDFTVVEDGEQRRIHFFEEMREQGRIDPEGLSLLPVDARRPTELPSLDGRTQGYVILGFDFDNLPVHRMGRAVKAAKRVVDQHSDEGILWSVLALGSTPYAVTDFSDDSAVIAEGLDTVMELRRGKAMPAWGGASFISADSWFTSTYSLLDPENRPPSEDADRLSGEAPAARGLNTFLEVVEKCRPLGSTAAIPGIREVVKTLAAASGRKSLVLFYDSVEVVAPTAMSADCLTAASGLSRVWQETSKLASTMGFQIYGADVSGLNREIGGFVPASKGGRTTPGTNPESYAKPLAGMTFFQIEDGTALAAEVTGGRDFSSNDLGLVLEGAVEDLRTYYSMSYEVDRPRDGEEHFVKVELKGRPGAQLRYRKSYLDVTRRQLLLEQLGASANLPKHGGSFPIDLEIVVEHTNETDEQLSMTAAVSSSVGRFGLIAGESGTRQANIEAFFVLHDSSGAVIHSEEVPRRLEVPDGTRALDVGFRQAWKLTLPKGSYTVTAAIYDSTDDVASVRSRRIDL